MNRHEHESRGKHRDHANRNNHQHRRDSRDGGIPPNKQTRGYGGDMDERYTHHHHHRHPSRHAPAAVTPPSHYHRDSRDRGSSRWDQPRYPDESGRSRHHQHSSSSRPPSRSTSVHSSSSSRRGSFDRTSHSPSARDTSYFTWNEESSGAERRKPLFQQSSFSEVSSSSDLKSMMGRGMLSKPAPSQPQTSRSTDKPAAPTKPSPPPHVSLQPPTLTRLPSTDSVDSSSNPPTPTFKTKTSISLSGFGQGLVAQKIKTIAKKAPELISPSASKPALGHQQQLEQVDPPEQPGTNIQQQQQQQQPPPPPIMHRLISSDVIDAFNEFDSLPSKPEILRSIEAVDEEIARSQSLLQETREKLDEIERVQRERINEAENAALEAKFHAEFHVSQELLHSKNTSVRVYAENLWKATASAKALEYLFPSWYDVHADGYQPLYLEVGQAQVFVDNRNRFEKHAKRIQRAVCAHKLRIGRRKLELARAWKEKEAEWVDKTLERLRKTFKEYCETHGLEQFVQESSQYSLQEPETERSFKNTLARLPDQYLDESVLARRFVNRNGLVTDSKEAERLYKAANPWTEEEKRMFRKRFLKYGKNFRRISNLIPKKSHNECVAYYYLTKYSLDSLNSYSSGGDAGKRSSSLTEENMSMVKKPKKDKEKIRRPKGEKGKPGRKPGSKNKPKKPSLDSSKSRKGSEESVKVEEDQKPVDSQEHQSVQEQHQVDFLPHPSMHPPPFGNEMPPAEYMYHFQHLQGMPYYPQAMHYYPHHPQPPSTLLHNSVAAYSAQLRQHSEHLLHSPPPTIHTPENADHHQEYDQANISIPIPFVAKSPPHVQPPSSSSLLTIPSDVSPFKPLPKEPL